MQASPITHIREEKRQGALFKSRELTGFVCCVDTEFFVDHEEPMGALGMARETWEWPLGSLPKGHGFPLVYQTRTSIII